MNPAPLGLTVRQCCSIQRRWGLSNPYQALLDSLLDLFDLDFGEAANLEKMLAVLSVNSLLTGPLALAHELLRLGN